jgi:cobalt/nickel transport system permease protein
MHMSDALLSPAVGGLFWAATAGVLGYCSHRIRNEADKTPVARMGIMGAFIFASQMINFTIPGTGSSGHLGGGLLLAVVLGPWAAFLTMATVLLVQALFFADGGILAFGANVFNLGFFTSFVAYPLVFKPIAGDFQNRQRVFVASLVAAVVGLQLGAFGVVLQTVFSGISALPFTTFVALMQPIHLAIGVVEGLVTAGVVLFLMQASPETLSHKTAPAKVFTRPWIAMAGAALVVGTMMSWFASQNPDGLEWSIGKVSGHEEIESPKTGAHDWFAQLQEKIAFLPDYAFSKEAEASSHATELASEPAQAWPSVDAGTSVSGLVGGGFVFAFTVAWALVLRFVRRQKAQLNT